MSLISRGEVMPSLLLPSQIAAASGHVTDILGYAITPIIQSKCGSVMHNRMLFTVPGLLVISSLTTKGKIGNGNTTARRASKSPTDTLVKYDHIGTSCMNGKLHHHFRSRY